MQRVYFISGLGADKTVFSYLDLSFCQPVYIDWIPPLKKESLEHYAVRLRKQIADPSPIVVGISFGGMLLTEMAKADNKIRAILISSCKTYREFPPLLRGGRYFPLYQWMPDAVLRTVMRKNSAILYNDNPQYKKTIDDILTRSDMSFVKWAIGAMLSWKNRTIPLNCIHIHGTGDRLLPLHYIKADHIVPGGSHVMTLDKHEELSDILKKLIFRNSYPVIDF